MLTITLDSGDISLIVLGTSVISYFIYHLYKKFINIYNNFVSLLNALVFSLEAINHTGSRLESNIGYFTDKFDKVTNIFTLNQSLDFGKKFADMYVPVLTSLWQLYNSSYPQPTKKYSFTTNLSDDESYNDEPFRFVNRPSNIDTTFDILTCNVPKTSDTAKPIIVNPPIPTETTVQPDSIPSNDAVKPTTTDDIPECCVIGTC